MYVVSITQHWEYFVICTILIMIGFGTICQYALADEAYLWIPPEMIQGIEYEGLLVQETSSGGIFFLTIEDSSKVITDYSVTIPPGSNHGIFKIIPQQNGNVSLYADINGEIVEAFSRVYSTGGKPNKLEIIFPTNITRAEIVTGFVITTDSNGSPALVKSNTKIHLDSLGSTYVPNSITILANSHYAKFKADIRGTSTIFASAPSFEHAEYKIKKEQNQIEIKLAVAPTIAAENSQTMVILWFEKNGKPFKPPRVIDAQISSSNTEIASIEKSSRVMHKDVGSVSIINGVGFKQITTHKAGLVVITASVQGFGSAQTSFVVGPARMDEVVELLTNSISGSSSNMAMIWAYPSISTGKFVGISSLYAIEYSDVDDAVENFTDLASEVQHQQNVIEKIIPVKLEGQTVLLSSAGLIHPNSILLDGGIGDERMLHAVKFDIIAENSGTYEIFASGPDLERTYASITSTEPYEETYKLVMTPLPTFIDVKQPLAMICVVDSDGAILNTSKTLGVNATVNISFEDVSEKLFFGVESCVIFDSKVNQSVRVLASMKNMEPIYADIHPAQTTISTKFDVPEKVHEAEEFPYVMHKIDSFGIPFARIEPDSVTGSIQLDNQRLLTHGLGFIDMVAFTPSNAVKFGTKVFANQMYFEILPSSASVRINQNVSVAIRSDVDAINVHVDSSVPVKELDDNKFVFTPNTEGIHTVIFTAESLGYSPTTTEFVITARKMVELNIKAVANNGIELGVNIESSDNNLQRGLQTPQILEAKLGKIDLSFPPEHVFNGHNYALANVVVNEQRINHVNGSMNVTINTDSNVVVQYERIIHVNVLGAKGSGVYPYGSNVVLSAPTYNVHSFLVREVFDGWVGFNANDVAEVSFIANSDVKGTISYKTDYSGLMIVLAVIITSVVIILLLRKKIHYLLNNSQTKIHNDKKLINNEADW